MDGMLPTSDKARVQSGVFSPSCQEQRILLARGLLARPPLLSPLPLKQLHHLLHHQLVSNLSHVVALKIPPPHQTLPQLKQTSVMHVVQRDPRPASRQLLLRQPQFTDLDLASMYTSLPDTRIRLVCAIHMSAIHMLHVLHCVCVYAYLG